MAGFDELVQLIAFMRSPNGCAWDRKQTIGDFEKHLRNESEEVLDAISRKDYDNLREELGDILWHVVFISQIASEQGIFTIGDVIDDLKAKIVRRHPHVFENPEDLTPEQVTARWEAIKEAEKGGE